MPDTKIGIPTAVGELNKQTLSQYGFHSAERSQSNPNAIQGYLDNVYDQFLNEQRLDERGLQDRIGKLKAELQQEKTLKMILLPRNHL